MKELAQVLVLVLALIGLMGANCLPATDYLKPIDIWDKELHDSLFGEGRTLACPEIRTETRASWDFAGKADPSASFGYAQDRSLRASFWPLTFIDPNAKNFRMENGLIQFTMGADQVRLGWGNYRWGEDQPFKCLTVKGDYNSRCDLVIRMKQTLPDTTWTVDFRYHGDPLDAGTWAKTTAPQAGGGPPMPDIPVAQAQAAEAGDWQEITAQFNAVAEADGLGMEITGKAGNKIAIDWMKITQINASIYARKVYTIPKGSVFSAKATVSTSLTVYVNGEVVRVGTHAPHGRARYDLIGIDLKPFLHPGRNVIALREVSRFVSTSVCWMQGAVQMVSGETIKIGTGLDWKCSTVQAPEWTQLDFDDSKWVSPGEKDPSGFLDEQMRPYVWHNPARLPNYSGQIELANPYLPKFFYNADESRPIKFQVRLPAGLAAKRPRVEYAVWNDMTGKEVAGGTAVGGAKKADALTYNITLQRKLDRGVYTLVLDAAGGKNPELHRQEIFVVVGKIPMPETEGKSWDEGMKVTLADEVNCTDPNDPHPFADASIYNPRFSSKIVTRNGLTYREAPVSDQRNQHAWMAWTVTFQQVGKPHYVIIDYPDDLPRLMEAQINPLHFRGATYYGRFSQETSWTGTGVLAGGRYLNTGEFQQLRFIVWAHEPKANIIISRANAWGGTPLSEKLNAGAAASRIRIYEIEQLPALRVNPHPDGRRIGINTERASVVNRTFGGSLASPGPNPYLGWFTQAERFAQYCRFSGLNAYFMGSYQYFFGSGPSVQLDNGAEGCSLVPDLRDMYINVLGANGVTTYSHIEYRTDMRSWSEGWISLHQALAGGDYMFQVDRKGVYQGGAYQRDNPMASKIARKALRDNLESITNRLSIYPSWKGLTFTYAPVWEGPCYDNADLSFDDQSIRLFEKETGIKIPVNDATTRRFPKRYDWIMANAKEKWFDWRSRKLAEVHEEMAKMVQSKRSDLEYMVVWEILAQDYSDNEKNRSVLEVMRDSGSDPRAYRGSQHVSFGRDIVTYDLAAGGRGNTAWTFLRDPELVGLLNECMSPHRVAFIRSGFDEWAIGSMIRDQVPKWYGGYWVCHVFPAHRHAPVRFVTLLIDSDIDTFEYGMCDCYQVSGSEQNLRQFVRALVSLPRSRFHPLKGNGLDRNICVKESKVGKDSYLLVINPAWWETQVTVTVQGGGLVTNTVDGRQVKLGKGSTLTANLPAYGIACFKRAGSLKALSAEAVPSQEGVQGVKSKLEEYGRLLGKDIPAEARQVWEAAQSAFAQGDLVTCWEKLTDWTLYRAVYVPE